LTQPQLVAVALVVVAFAVLATRRLPAELVALTALIVGVIVRVVPADRAFAGYGSGLVAAIAALSLVSAAITRSGAVEVLVRPLLRRAGGGWLQLPVLAGSAALLAGVTGGSCALSALIPFATQASVRTGSPVSRLLMPMAFASMAGGLVTLIGGTATLAVARARGDLLGAPFALFDIAPVGLGVAAVVALFACAGRRLLPVHHAAVPGADAHARSFVAEARMPADSSFAGRTVAELEGAAGEGAVRVATIVRERFRRVDPTPDERVMEDDVLLLAGEPDELERLIATAGLSFEGDGETPGEEGEVVREGVVTLGSALVGAAADSAALRARHGVGVRAAARHEAPVLRRLAFLRLMVGDVLILKGARDRMGEAMEALRVLPLSERPLALGARRRSWAPAAVLAGALTLAVLGAAPLPVTLVAAAVAVLLLRAMTPDEAYKALGGSQVLAVGALVPVADALRGTGASGAVAGALAMATDALPPALVLALALAAVMVAASFLDAVLVALVAAPVAALVAQRSGLSPDAFLMAVAVGAACGFLGSGARGPAALVAAPGCYLPADYCRLGLPLSLAVVAVATGLIAFVRPLGAG
jgi:di/tricarboxylate transporter